MKWFYAALFCLGLTAALMWLLVQKANTVTALRMRLPLLEREVKRLEEQERRLQLEIDAFENPINLIQLAKKPQFGHLIAPKEDDVLLLREEPASF